MIDARNLLQEKSLDFRPQKVVLRPALKARWLHARLYIYFRSNHLNRFQNVFGLKSCHCAAAFSLQVPKSCADLNRTLLYISILRTYRNIVLKKRMLALGVCLPQPCSRVGRRFAVSLKITFDLLPNNWFPQKQI